MIAQLKFFLKDVVFYGIASVALRFVALVTTPIIARLLTTADYGIVDAITTLSFILIGFALFGQESAIARHYYEADDEQTRRQIIATGVWLSGLLALVTALILMASASIVSYAWLGVDASAAYRLMALTIPLAVINQHLIGLLKWTFRRIRYFILALGTALFTLLATIIFVSLLRMDIAGVFIAQLVAQGLATVLGLIFCRDLIGLPATTLYLRRLLSFGWPYMVIAVGSYLGMTLDRVFVSQYLSIEDLGLYAAGAKAAALMAIVTGGFQIAWGPFAFSRYQEADAPRTFSAVLSLYTAAMLALTILLSTYSGLVLTLLVSSRYIAGHAVVGILALGTAINGIQWVTGLGIAVAKRTHLIALAYILGIVIGIGSYPLLIPLLGKIGAALGTFIVQVAMTLLVTHFAQKVYPYPYKFKLILLMLAIAALCIVWQTMIGLPATPMDWVLRTIGGLIAIGLIIALLLCSYPEALRLKWGRVPHAT